MNRLIWVLALCSAFLSLQGIETSADTLYVRVLLAKSRSLSLNCPTPVIVRENDGLIAKEIKGQVLITLDQEPGTKQYRIFAKTALSDLDHKPDSTNEQSFTWADSALICREYRLTTVPMTFLRYDEAVAYAQRQGLPVSAIYEDHEISSTVKITHNEGTDYLQLPVELISEGLLKIGTDPGLYQGTLFLDLVGDELALSTSVELNSYVAGVLPSEIGNTAPLEALKAQAIAARTHALSLALYARHMQDKADLCATTHCQVYRGSKDVNDKVLRAVSETRDEVLLYKGKLADTPYHSSCGGKTDASSSIWNGSPIDYLMGITCNDLADSLDLTREQDAERWINTKDDLSGLQSWEKAATYWESTISTDRLATNCELNCVSKIDILKRSHSGRIVSLRISGDKVKLLKSESAIRKAFGGIPSSFFVITNPSSDSLSPGITLHLKGKGSGHGVGMCQIGALRMSRDGNSTQMILDRYFPGTTINKIRINYVH